MFTNVLPGSNRYLTLTDEMNRAEIDRAIEQLKKRSAVEVRHATDPEEVQPVQAETRADD